ncbi:hypothetical protein EX30DRAFT_373356 [Ascodesmis nigricans]|uniref:Uncharacterized protein n=1 Tax=Ascodesmis nigricans TaxID=341454 RepID=A0A4S2MRW8_9PEZI|nr:hypothetical protein EX30DRAFT_373356 [Ascodesmis nigricans]
MTSGLPTTSNIDDDSPTLTSPNENSSPYTLSNDSEPSKNTTNTTNNDNTANNITDKNTDSSFSPYNIMPHHAHELHIALTSPHPDEHVHAIYNLLILERLGIPHNNVFELGRMLDVSARRCWDISIDSAGPPPPIEADSTHNHHDTSLLPHSSADYNPDTQTTAPAPLPQLHTLQELHAELQELARIVNNAALPAPTMALWLDQRELQKTHVDPWTNPQGAIRAAEERRKKGLHAWEEEDWVEAGGALMLGGGGVGEGVRPDEEQEKGKTMDKTTTSSGLGRNRGSVARMREVVAERKSEPETAKFVKWDIKDNHNDDDDDEEIETLDTAAYPHHHRDHHEDPSRTNSLPVSFRTSFPPPTTTTTTTSGIEKEKQKHHPSFSIPPSTPPRGLTSPTSPQSQTVQYAKLNTTPEVKTRPSKADAILGITSTSCEPRIWKSESPMSSPSATATAATGSLSTSKSNVGLNSGMNSIGAGAGIYSRRTSSLRHSISSITSHASHASAASSSSYSSSSSSASSGAITKSPRSLARLRSIALTRTRVPTTSVSNPPGGLGGGGVGGVGAGTGESSKAAAMLGITIPTLPNPSTSNTLHPPRPPDITTSLITRYPVTPPIVPGLIPSLPHNQPHEKNKELRHTLSASSIRPLIPPPAVMGGSLKRRYSRSRKPLAESLSVSAPSSPEKDIAAKSEAGVIEEEEPVRESRKSADSVTTGMSGMAAGMGSWSRRVGGRVAKRIVAEVERQRERERDRDRDRENEAAGGRVRESAESTTATASMVGGLLAGGGWTGFPASVRDAGVEGGEGVGGKEGKGKDGGRRVRGPREMVRKESRIKLGMGEDG